MLTDAETVGLGIAGVLDCEKAAGELLCKLLLTAARLKNKTLLKTDFSAEVYMPEGGGCEIVFSPCRTRVRPKKRERQVFGVVEFPGPDTMLKAIDSLFAVCPKAGGGLYTKNGRYRLVFKTVPVATVCTLLLGFGEPVMSPAAAGHTLEYWNPVCPENAVASVGAALSAIKRR